MGPISEDNYLEWEALVPGPDGTPFEGGVFAARLSFTSFLPLEPPTMRFDPPIFHPNVYADGLVCISILHAPGDDPIVRVLVGTMVARPVDREDPALGAQHACRAKCRERVPTLMPCVSADPTLW